MGTLNYALDVQTIYIHTVGLFCFLCSLYSGCYWSLFSISLKSKESELCTEEVETGCSWLKLLATVVFWLLACMQCTRRSRRNQGHNLVASVLASNIAGIYCLLSSSWPCTSGGALGPTVAAADIDVSVGVNIFIIKNVEDIIDNRTQTCRWQCRLRWCFLALVCTHSQSVSKKIRQCHVGYASSCGFRRGLRVFGHSS